MSVCLHICLCSGLFCCEAAGVRFRKVAQSKGNPDIWISVLFFPPHRHNSSPPFFCLFAFVLSLKNGKLEIECSAEDGVERAPSLPLSSSLTLSSHFSIKVVSVMRRKFYKWGERLHSVVTLNFNVAHGNVYSVPSQYLIQQLERLWGATENIYCTRIAVVFIYFVLSPPLSTFTLSVCRFTLSCFSDISGDNSRLFLTLWRDSALLKWPLFFFFDSHVFYEVVFYAIRSTHSTAFPSLC